MDSDQLIIDLMAALAAGYPVMYSLPASGSVFQNYGGGVLSSLSGPVDHENYVVGCSIPEPGAYSQAVITAVNSWGPNFGEGRLVSALAIRIVSMRRAHGARPRRYRNGVVMRNLLGLLILFAIGCTPAPAPVTPPTPDASDAAPAPDASVYAACCARMNDKSPHCAQVLEENASNPTFAFAQACNICGLACP